MTTLYFRFITNTMLVIQTAIQKQYRDYKYKAAAHTSTEPGPWITVVAVHVRTLTGTSRSL